MKKDPKLYLLDIVQAIEDIFSHVKGLDKNTFFIDIKSQDAVIRKITIIGKATKRLPSALRAREKNVAWKKMMGMRDIVVHDYSEINLMIVWNVIKKDLPGLKKAVEKILREL